MQKVWLGWEEGFDHDPEFEVNCHLIEKHRASELWAELHVVQVVLGAEV